MNHKHKLDVLSLIFGLIFVVVGLAFLLPGSGEQLADTLRQVFSWGGPVLIIAAGLALLLPSIKRKEAETPPSIDDSELELDLGV